jgi:phosphoglycerate dehydrogenase-like enzyme
MSIIVTMPNLAVNMPTIIVTELEYSKAEPVFADSLIPCIPSPAAEEDLAETILEHGARHAIVGVNPYRERLYTALSRGSVLARFGVGHDGIDKPRATAAGVFCTNTPGVLDQSVAEHTMLLMASAARRLIELAPPMAQGKWAPVGGSELYEKKLAVIGCGPIGSAVARIASLGYGMRVIGMSRSGRCFSPAGFSEILTDFAEAVDQADYVSLHIPATTENRHFIDQDRLSQMAPSAWLINTARGAVVDEAALYEALAEGRLGGAALDVYEREPYVPSPKGDLRLLPNVILTPHVGSNTIEANHRMAQRALQNIGMAESGQFRSMDLLNPEVLNE